jgi:hypothetical protein
VQVQVQTGAPAAAPPQPQCGRCHTPGRPTGALGPLAHLAAAQPAGGGRQGVAGSAALQQPAQWVSAWVGE